MESRANMNSYMFIDRLKDFTEIQDLTMASLYVKNLFTSIPLFRTIEICLNSLFKLIPDTVMGLNSNFLNCSWNNLF
jgi:hypothetical protein